MLRPLTPDGSRPKRHSELNDSERTRLKKIEENGRNLRTERRADGTARREK